jgi:alkylhydroperoxidase family enzyme
VVSARDTASLRAVGFDDRTIHDVYAVTDSYGFVNRIAQGSGVELESRFPADP